MSILIKGMEMPASCEECALWDIDHACCRVPSVPWTDYFFGEARLDDCPLVPVPTPHGKLKDADKLLKKGINLSWSVQKWVSEVDIELMPTIIEAEEGEKE